MKKIAPLFFAKENESQPQEAQGLFAGKEIGFEGVMDSELSAESESQHRKKVESQARDFVERRSRGTTHPVWDFLFTYYNFSPQKLMTWIPFMGETFEVPSSDAPTVTHRWPKMKTKDLRQLIWIRELCAKIGERPAKFGCHGLHEWAMVYGMSAEQVRHNGYQLRMSPEELTSFVNRQTITCTHYDAFRFFTPSALPLNTFQPKLETRLQLEQGGCLHANMDLYKWSYKLWPWIGSDMVADAFVLALEGRQLDMEASPYDLADLGFPPLLLETEVGRAEYRERQAELAEKSAALRAKMLQRCDRLISMAPADEVESLRASLVH